MCREPPVRYLERITKVNDERLQRLVNFPIRKHQTVT
jgi:hypothetical protein